MIGQHTDAEGSSEFGPRGRVISEIRDRVDSALSDIHHLPEKKDSNPLTDFGRSVGRAIGAVRRLLGTSQAEVHKATGLTVNYLSLLENGHRGPSIEALGKIAHFLRFPISFFAALGETPTGDLASVHTELRKFIRDYLVERLCTC